MDSLRQIVNKYKKTCSVCNRSVFPGELILWNTQDSTISHLPEMCLLLGIRKKRKSTREDGTNPRAKGTNPRAKRIEEYTFPVEVSYK